MDTLVMLHGEDGAAGLQEVAEVQRHGGWRPEGVPKIFGEKFVVEDAVADRQEGGPLRRAKTCRRGRGRVSEPSAAIFAVGGELRVVSELPRGRGAAQVGEAERGGGGGGAAAGVRVLAEPEQELAVGWRALGPILAHGGAEDVGSDIPAEVEYPQHGDERDGDSCNWFWVSRVSGFTSRDMGQ